MGPNEPIWRTNRSFLPPLSIRWDYQLPSEELVYESNDDGVVALDDSSLSSNSKEIRSWINGEQVHDHRYSASDGAFSYFNSLADSYLNQQLMPPPVEEVSINDYVRASSSVPQTFSRFAEGTSRVPESVGSLSSRSDDSEYDLASKTHASSHHSFSSCCSFMSKPIHPFSFSEYTVDDEESYGRTPRREPSRWSGNCSMDFIDVSGRLETECFGLPHKNLYGASRCGLCDRFLSQRSPWGSRRMVWSGDMPITGVLSCWHVFHAECLE